MRIKGVKMSAFKYMSNAYLCMDTYTHITIHLYLNMLQSYWYKCTKSPPHTHTDTQMQRHTHLSSRQSLVSVVAADSWVTVLLLLLLHVFHTADTRHRSHTWHTHRRQVCVYAQARQRAREPQWQRGRQRENAPPTLSASHAAFTLLCKFWLAVWI